MNISIIGDSISRGVIYNKVRARYELAKDSFSNILKKRPALKLDNYSRMGNTSEDGLGVLNRRFAKLGQSDYTLLEFGGNDCNYDWASVAADPYCDHDSLVTPSCFRRTMLQMIRRVREAGSTPVLLNLPPLVPSRFFDWVSQGLDWEGILQFMDGDLSTIQDWHQEYNKIIGELASSEGLILVDLYSAFQNQPDPASLICCDGMHPNEAGHALMADVIEETLFYPPMRQVG